jgi:predicted DNA-binding ribbon-helix-helix protein
MKPISSAPGRARRAPRNSRRSRLPAQGIILNGHPTSLRLDPEWRQWLREIAAECGMTVRALIEGIMLTKNPKCPLTSAIRLYVAAYFRGPHYMIVDRRYGTRRAKSTPPRKCFREPPRAA